MNQNDINNASHILVVVDNNSFANGNALYSYLLSLHKKVTLFSVQTPSPIYTFLPWFSKVRTHKPGSCDLELVISSETLFYYEIFAKNREVKINQKIATSLYAGLLQRYEMFSKSDVDAKVFAIASELITLGAEHTICREFLHNRVPLSFMRLKASVLNTLSLQENATIAQITVCEETLKASGAIMSDVYAIMKEVLQMVHVQEVHLCKSDLENKIIKILKDS